MTKPMKPLKKPKPMTPEQKAAVAARLANSLMKKVL